MLQVSEPEGQLKSKVQAFSHIFTGCMWICTYIKEEVTSSSGCMSQNEIMHRLHNFRFYIWILLSCFHLYMCKVGWMRELCNSNGGQAPATTDQEANMGNGNVSICLLVEIQTYQVLWSLKIFFIALLCNPNNHLFCISFCPLRVNRKKKKKE